MQGFEEADPLIRICVSSWARHNPDWSLHCLSESNLKEHLDPVFCDEILSMRIPVQKKANLIRLALIAKHGGVWVDADCFCTRPLDGWIEEAAQSGFFAFRMSVVEPWFMNRKPWLWRSYVWKTLDRILATWFLAGAPQSAIPTAFLPAHRQLLEAASNGQRKPRPRLAKWFYGMMSRNAYLASFLGRPVFAARLGEFPYFIFHYHFARLVRTDRAFRAAWKYVVPIPAADAVTYRYSLGSPVSDSFIHDMGGSAAPLYKLNRRKAIAGQDGVTTQYDWLVQSFGPEAKGAKPC